MKNKQFLTMFLVVGIIFMLIGCAATQEKQQMEEKKAMEEKQMMEKSLYERLGGEGALTAVVAQFLENVAADERINKRFARTDLADLQRKLIDQIGQATGGPQEYTGLDMKRAHAGMGITNAEFDALVEDLVAALDKFNVPQKEKDELLGILGPMRSDIVEQP